MSQVIIFLMTLLLNKFISIVMDACKLDEIHANHWNKVWCIMHSKIYEIWMIDHLVKGEYLQHRKSTMCKYFTENDKQSQVYI